MGMYLILMKSTYITKVMCMCNKTVLEKLDFIFVFFLILKQLIYLLYILYYMCVNRYTK